MAYEYERDVIDELEQMGADYESNGYFNMSIEVEEVYRKAKAFDEIIKTFKDSDLYTNDDVIEIIQEQLDELERANDET